MTPPSRRNRRQASGGASSPDLDWFLAAAAELGFTRRTRLVIGSQVIARLLIQTGKPLGQLAEADFGELAEACRQRERDEGVGWRHYSSAMHAARSVLFHMGVLPAAPVNPRTAFRLSLERRMADVPPSLRGSFVAYLERLTATHARQTVGATATRLAHFGRHLAATDPGSAR